MGSAFNFYLVRPKEDGAEWIEDELVKNHETEREKCMLKATEGKGWDFYEYDSGDCATDVDPLQVYDDIQIELGPSDSWEDLERIKEDKTFNPHPTGPEDFKYETLARIVKTAEQQVDRGEFDFLGYVRSGVKMWLCGC